jgi:hypothetical protein
LQGLSILCRKREAAVVLNRVIKHPPARATAADKAQYKV